jgi:hypothetical protein
MTAFVLAAVVIGVSPAAQDAGTGAPGPEHQFLNSLQGRWQVSMVPVGATEPGEPVGSADARSRLGGRFVEFELDLEAGPIRHALYTFGFDRRHDVFTVIAMDNTGPYFVTGRGKREGSRIAMYGTDEDPVMREMGFDKEFVIALDARSVDHIRIEILFIDTRTPARTELPFMAFDLRRAQTTE